MSCQILLPILLEKFCKVCSMRNRLWKLVQLFVNFEKYAVGPKTDQNTLVSLFTVSISKHNDFFLNLGLLYHRCRFCHHCLFQHYCRRLCLRQHHTVVAVVFATFLQRVPPLTQVFPTIVTFIFCCVTPRYHPMHHDMLWYLIVALRYSFVLISESMY